MSGSLVGPTDLAVSSVFASLLQMSPFKMLLVQQNVHRVPEILCSDFQVYLPNQGMKLHVYPPLAIMTF